MREKFLAGEFNDEGYSIDEYALVNECMSAEEAQAERDTVRTYNVVPGSKQLRIVNKIDKDDVNSQTTIYYDFALGQVKYLEGYIGSINYTVKTQQFKDVSLPEMEWAIEKFEKYGGELEAEEIDKALTVCKQPKKILSPS